MSHQGGEKKKLSVAGGVTNKKYCRDPSSLDQISSTILNMYLATTGLFLIWKVTIFINLNIDCDWCVVQLSQVASKTSAKLLVCQSGNWHTLVNCLFLWAKSCTNLIIGFTKILCFGCVFFGVDYNMPLFKGLKIFYT